jgi:hypothetical protein
LYLALTALHQKKPYFRPAMLPEKWPITDMVVELTDYPGELFLLQAKTTQHALAAGAQSVPIDISAKRLNQLLDAPIPAYVVAVHEPTGTSYIGRPLTRKRIRSVPMTHALRVEATLIALRDEVHKFWNALPKKKGSASTFDF